MSVVHLLHVDDDPDIREIVGIAISSDPMFTIRSCASGEEALAVTAKWSPDLILLDFNMPGMDGPATVTRLRERPQTSGIPVIYITASAEAGQLAQLHFSDVVGVIAKPLDPARLCAHIVAVMCRSHRKLDSDNREKASKAVLALSIIESSADGIIVKDLDGTVLLWNAAAERLAQFKAPGVIGRNIRSIVPMDQPAREESLFDQVRMGEAVARFETKRCQKDSNITDVSFKASSLHDRAGNVIGGAITVHDLTEQRKIENALSETEQRLALAIQGMSVGVWDWNIRENTLYWSDRFKEMLGLLADFAPSYLEFETRLHPEDRIPTVNMLLDHVNRKSPYDVECRLRHESGDYIWFRSTGQAAWGADGKPIRMVGSVDDITQRKRAEERFRLVVESAPAAMIMINRFGEMVLVNRPTEQLFGYARSDLLGQPIDMLLPQSYRRDHQNHIHRYFASGPSERAMGNGRILAAVRKGGSEFSAEISLTPIDTDDGIMVLAAVVDVTLRKQAEDASRLFQERLEQQVAQRTAQLEAANKDLDDFAYATSHDLKAPLRVIDNASKWLEEDLEPHLTTETRENMHLLRSRVARLERLLDDLLRFSRIGREPGGTEIISGQELIDNVLALLTVPDGFDVKITGFDRIRVSRMPLQQILLNLAGNSIKHHDKSTGQIEVTAEDLGSLQAFAVSDDGCGIAAQYHDRIFKMFQTLKPRDQVEGSGMGLAIVRKYIDQSGGSLSLESSEGAGSCFRFTLPSPSIIQEQSR